MRWSYSPEDGPKCTMEPFVCKKKDKKTAHSPVQGTKHKIKEMADRRSSMGSSSDDPPNSRLFIIGPKTLTEEDFRRTFQEFGHIEEIWVVKDRNTGENKGVTYIKYSKTSAAAKALETMNGKIIGGGGGRSIKVMIAASREQGSKRDLNEEEKIQRLFVVVPKSMTDSELYDYFKQFGDIDYASIIKDKNTRESKGFAYVKYIKFSHAATAFEQCDRKYKPVFAEPRKSNVSRNDDRSFSSTSFDTNMSKNALPGPPEQFSNDGYNKLVVIASPSVNQDQLWKLFDIIPGMEYCQLHYDGDRVRPTRAIAEVVYANPQWASYAKEKLHGFEYPPGYRLIVRAEYDNMRSPFGSKSSNTEKQKPDILQIAQTIAQASNLMQAAGLSPDLLQQKLGLLPAGKESTNYCNVKLPDPQPFANIDEETAARCFIVCTPSALPNSVLKDIFCRFGNLIDVYMLNNRNCGYAKYASKASADDAIKTLHGAEICGNRIKVMEAEERPDSSRKRQRIDVESPF
ncbi:hypothetical protein NQ315_005578 [Exocentrus adspersus]|uniref:RRM domain-containing protein n=1 Tax=Exocentrus adspersus TaxID=1586481 RepID=A0AAV8VTG4_9CUCU|nr:hypothetical protein NQ315_005578 [Exocentrus adspersus]